MHKLIVFGTLIFVSLLVGTAQGQSANQQLLDAITARNMAGVQTALANGADVNAKDKDGSTPLMQAAFRGPKDVVELLIAKGAHVSAKDNDGDTTLHYVALGAKFGLDSSAIAELLIAKGADVNARDEGGDTVLDKVGGLGENKGTEATRAVLLAAMRNSIKSPAEAALIKQLLSAIDAGDTAKVGEILGDGANPNAMFGDAEGTSLDEAACVGLNQKAIVEILLAHGADVNAKDKYGNSPLHYAAGCTYKNDLTAVVELFIAKGADVNARGQIGHEPLDSAAEQDNLDVMKILIDHGADINAKGTFGGTDPTMDHFADTPLGIAAIGLYKNEIELLISKGADLNAKNNAGETPLQRMNYIQPDRVCPLPGGLLDKGCEITKKEVIALLQSHASKDQNSIELVKSDIEHFKGRSDNDTMRQYIIDLVLKMNPPPAIPPEAEAAAGRGTYIFKNAASPDDVLSAAKQYLSAIEAAPWVPNYYYNLCIVLEKTPYTQQALHACKLYLVAAPGAADAGAVRQRIAGLQYAVDRDKAQMQQRTRYIKDSGGIEEFYRFGGVSGTVSGKDIVLKLFIDWTAAPPQYKMYVGCIVGGDVYGNTHDLVSTDTWMNFCNSTGNVHLIIKPEGEGFVEVSDSNGGDLRATLDELFTAKRKTMAQAVLFSASGDHGDQYYVPYLQGGNDMKHAGFAMYESDCNGSILIKDPRALPDGFIPADKFNAGDYGRYTPEVIVLLSQPMIDVCSQQFASKTGYHFGEAE